MHAANAGYFPEVMKYILSLLDINLNSIVKVIASYLNGFQGGMNDRYALSGKLNFSNRGTSASKGRSQITLISQQILKASFYLI